VDQEVAKTLGELELKLQQLEHELTSIGHNDPRADAGHPPAPTPTEVHPPTGVHPPPGVFPPSTGASRAPTDATRAPEETSEAPGKLSHAPTGPSHAPTGPSHAPGKLVDEAIEPSTSDQASVDSDGFGGPLVFGGEEVPALAGGTVGQDWKVDIRETAYGEIPKPPAPPTPPPGPDPGPPIPPPVPQPPPSTPPGPPSPATPPAPTQQPDPQPIDVAELVRFKQKMRRTLDELIDEYSRLLPPDRPYGPNA
jgi:hypothetical protein